MKRVTEEGEVLDIPKTRQITLAPGPLWKTPYNHDTDAEAAATALDCKDPSKTQQQFAKDADINNILAKFLNTGEMNLIGTPVYMEIADEETGDLQDRIVTQYQVEQAWNELPAAARHAFRDPKVFLDYVDHCMATGDLEPLQELGLAVKPEPPGPTEKAAVSPAPPPADGPPKAPDAS